MQRILGAVLDIDGVIWTHGAPSPGAPELIDSLSAQGFPFCFLTNDCLTSKSRRVAQLNAAGLPLAGDRVITAPEVTSTWLRDAKVQSILYLGSLDAAEDLLPNVEIRSSAPVDAVVVGDLFDTYDRHALEQARRAIIGGALFVAMHHKPTWYDGSETFVDNGFWIAGLEYVTKHTPIVTGKPSPIAYLTAIRRLGSGNDLTALAVISDDIDDDLWGGKALGLKTIYFGPSREVPPWVDARANSMRALRQLLQDYGC